MGHAAGNQRVVPFLENEVGDHADQVDVSAPLADAVDGPLHLHRAVPHGDQRIGRRHVAVVMAVDSDRDGKRLAGRVDSGGDPLRQAAAVGVAQNDDLGPAFLGGPDRPQGKVGVAGEAVEEMFGVVDHAPPLGPQIGDRVADHRQVFLRADAEDFAHVQVPAFADQRDDFGLRIAERLHADVFFGGDSLSARHSEGGDLRVLERQVGDALEILGVFRIRQGIAPFDEVEPELVELGGDRKLVLEREVDPFALAAVAERRVVDLDAGHGCAAFQELWALRPMRTTNAKTLRLAA